MTVARAVRVRRSEAEPRFATPRVPGRENRLRQMAGIARAIGTPFMPWQELVAEVASEIDDETGLPAYRTVAITVPRQSGKTSLVLAAQVDRCLFWGDVPQLVVYTAQTGKDAREKLIDDQSPLLKRGFGDFVEKVLRGIGSERVLFDNGSRIIPLPNTPDAGHGKTIHLAVLDELFADNDERRMGAVGPAMITVADAQQWVLSTAGDETSTALRRIVELGRASVREGRTSGLAYFEWSAPGDADPDDEETWWGCMPALGWTQTVEAVRTERGLMSDGEFRRAYLNQWWDTEDRVFAAGLWEACVRDTVQPEAPLVFGVDGRPDLSQASIVAADSQERLELIDARPNADWVWPRLVELADRWGAPVAIDTTGPLGYLADKFERDGLDVVRLGTRDMVHACQGLFDAVMSGRLRVRSAHEMDAAVQAAEQRKVGEAWMWSRYTVTDPSPLLAATIARHAAAAHVPQKVTAWLV